MTQLCVAASCPMYCYISYVTTLTMLNDIEQVVTYQNSSENKGHILVCT